MAFEKTLMDPVTGNPANEGSFKTAYFGWSFHLKQPYNEGGGLGTCKECGECYLKAVLFKFIFNVIISRILYFLNCKIDNFGTLKKSFIIFYSPYCIVFRIIISSCGRSFYNH